MPLATVTKSTLDANFTQAQFVTALTNSLNNCGFSSNTFIAQGTVSGAVKTAYSHQFNASSKGTVFLEYEINSSVSTLSLRISDNYNTSTYTATGQSSINSLQFSLSNSNVHDLYAINHPEIRGVAFLRQGTTNSGFLGYLRPATIPSWWNQNSFLYCLAYGTTANPNRFAYLPFPNSYSAGASFAVGLLAYTAPSSGYSLGGGNGENTSDLLLSPLAYANDRGYFGQLSTDIAIGRVDNLSAQTLTPGDKYIVTAGSQEYTIIYNSGSFGLGVRTA